MIVSWVDSPDALTEVLAWVRDAPALAVDTEFHRERTYRPVLGLIQLASRDHLALVDPLAVDPSPLIALFRDIPLVLHAGDQDLGIFAMEFGVVPSTVFDTQIAAGFLGLSSPSLMSLVEARLAVRLEKGDQLSDWTRRPLSDSAKNYAAADVAHLLDLEASLREELEPLGRLDWALEECADATLRATTTVDPTAAWWKLKGSRRLRAPAAGVAQMVGVWRETVAATRNRPPRSVLPDLAYAALVARRPRTRDELQHLRGMEGRPRFGTDEAAALMEAIERGAELSEQEIHRPPEPLRSRVSPAVITVLTAYANELATEANLDPALVATRSDVTAFASGVACRLDHGWRHALVAEPMTKLLSGEAHMVIDGNRLMVQPTEPEASQEPIAETDTEETR